MPQKEQQRAKEEGTDLSAIDFLKRYTVFNAEQCDGLPAGLLGTVKPRTPREVIPEAEALIGATGADFRIGGDQAFYVYYPLPSAPPASTTHSENDPHRLCRARTQA